MKKNDLLRLIPRVDDLTAFVQNANADLPHSVVLECSRLALDKVRLVIQEDGITEIPSLEKIASCVLDMIRRRQRLSLKPVINASGVVLHTNLGRAVLAKKAAENVYRVATNYSTLEYSLETGARSSRHSHIEPLICDLTGAEAAMVVNNNAAAIMLALQTIASGGEVVVSRGELVEIGGSFRVPDIMALSGAILREVGTTNKTKPSDYLKAINENTSALLKVHTSNFKIVGFTEDVDIAELCALAREKSIPVIYDLGSGLLADIHGTAEKNVIDCIASGADVVCFSGDKLLGGPQAGIIAGKRKYIDAMKANQLARVVRIDKLTLAALEATLKIYREGNALVDIPLLRDLSAPLDVLEKRAKALCRLMKPKAGFRAVAKRSEGQVGGGSAPGQNLQSFVVEITSQTRSAQAIERKLRESDPPIIARINKDAVLIDVRTVAEGDLKRIADAFSDQA